MLNPPMTAGQSFLFVGFVALGKVKLINSKFHASGSLIVKSYIVQLYVTTSGDFRLH